MEPVEAYGKSIGDNEFFWKKIPVSYPELASALRRIKVYRHHRVHIKLEDNASEELSMFLHRDLAGQNPSMNKELWFHLQQCVLDELFIATLVETERFVQ